MDKRLLILGASGFIGSYLYDALGAVQGLTVLGTYCCNPASDLKTLDVLDAAALQQCLQDFRPDVVIFLAGSKAVDRCEREPSFALDLNVLAVKNYIAACIAVGINPSTLYFSTDYVFNGLDGGYTPQSIVGPRTVYGLTNLIAERLLATSGLPGILLRVSAVMGLQGGFYKWIRSGLENGETLELYSNTYFSPTSIVRVIRFVQDYICSLDDSSCSEEMVVRHLSDGYRMTRYEFGRVVARGLGKRLDQIRPSLADVKHSSFHLDLSLIPDELQSFLPNDDWNEMEWII